MGVVQEFVEADDVGWDVTRHYKAFVSEMIIELNEHPHVMIVMTHNRTALINRKYIKVKVVNNGTGDSEQELVQAE